jgi:hypothetical protein
MPAKKNPPPMRKWSTKTLYRHLVGYLDAADMPGLQRDWTVDDLLDRMKDDIVAEETGMPGQTTIPVDET